MGNSTNDIDRYQRYRRIVTAVLDSAEFSLTKIKQSCYPEKPIFVTRIVRELTNDGLLKEFGPKTKPFYRWLDDRALFNSARWLDSKIYSARITRAPLADRPRERLLAEGAPSMRTAELLAILVRAGRPGESALLAGEKIAARFADELEKLPDAGRGELKSISRVVEQTAYCQIMAGIELGRRVCAASNGAKKQTARICGTEDALAFCKENFARLAEDGIQEEFHIVSLDTKHHVIGTHRISIGSLDGAHVHPREVFRPAIKDAAAAVILVHNHPSGDPTPSSVDMAITHRLEEVGRNVGIEILDHIIVARRDSVSIRENPAGPTG